MSNEDTPFGPGWHQEMMKLPKTVLVQMFKDAKIGGETPASVPSTVPGGSAKYTSGWWDAVTKDLVADIEKGGCELFKGITHIRINGRTFELQLKLTDDSDDFCL